MTIELHPSAQVESRPTFHVAKKAHVCGDCGDVIQPGSRYSRYRVTPAGKPHRCWWGKRCLGCQAIADAAATCAQEQAEDIALLDDLEDF